MKVEESYRLKIKLKKGKEFLYDKVNLEYKTLNQVLKIINLLEKNDCIEKGIHIVDHLINGLSIKKYFLYRRC